MTLEFTLLLVSSADAFIAREPGENPSTWASREEQVLFLTAVEAADWSVMGRATHEAADKPHRRRIIFSANSEPGWHRPTQLWLDPAKHTPQTLPDQVKQVHPLKEGLILGGTQVHDWFHAHGAIHLIHLTIEPLTFGSGVPIFSGDTTNDPLEEFRRRGYEPLSEHKLNARGTRYITLRPAG